VYDRLSAQGLEAVHLAEEEARAMGHEYLGTEHLLLGLLAQQDTLAASALRTLGVEGERVRSEAVRILGAGDGGGSETVPLTPLATRALERTAEEATAHGRDLADGEDLLLGLTEVKDGLAVRILERMDVSADQIRGTLGRPTGQEPAA
jgi:ATP-dependent Clp protease ATP-binding subunit ClpC